MTAPEVDFIFTSIKDHYGVSPLSDIPLERIDRDNANNIDGTWTHQHSEDPEEMNFFSAALVSRPQQPSGTGYNLSGDAVVSCQVVGMAASGSTFGAIDPGDSVQPAGVSYPTVAWDTLTDNIRRAILTDRKFPSVGRTNTSYKDLFIENWNDNSQAYSDWYQLTFDVRFTGFETLP